LKIVRIASLNEEANHRLQAHEEKEIECELGFLSRTKANEGGKVKRTKARREICIGVTSGPRFFSSGGEAPGLQKTELYQLQREEKTAGEAH